MKHRLLSLEMIEKYFRVTTNVDMVREVTLRHLAHDE